MINCTMEKEKCGMCYAVVYDSMSCLLYLLGQKAQTNKAC